MVKREGEGERKSVCMCVCLCSHHRSMVVCSGRSRKGGVGERQMFRVSVGRQIIEQEGHEGKPRNERSPAVVLVMLHVVHYVIVNHAVN